MKFLILLASIMLIALSSQHPIMGLPVNITVVTETCPEGHELINSQCQPIDSWKTSTEFETSTIHSKDVIVSEDKPTTIFETSSVHPEDIVVPDDKSTTKFETSTVHSKNLIVPEDKPTTKFETSTVHFEDIAVHEDQPTTKFETSTVHPEDIVVHEDQPTTKFETSSVHPEDIVVHEDKPKIKFVTSTVHPEDIVVHEDQPTTKFETSSVHPEDIVIHEDKPTTKFETSSVHPEDIVVHEDQPTIKFETSTVHHEDIVVHEDKPVTKLTPFKKSGACPDGMQRSEYGVCEKITSFETTTVPVESTSDRYESVGGVEEIKGCPEGTEADEQGACQEIKPSKIVKKVTDPKLLLKRDGSCPENYRMIEGRCLYIKLKPKSTLYQTDSTADDDSVVRRPYSSKTKSSKVELVPVLGDNSCPEGTEYSEYGLCQKRIHIKPDDSCPENYELVNGKCIYQTSKVQTQPRLTRSTTISMVESTTPAYETSNRAKLFTSTTIDQ